MESINILVPPALEPLTLAEAKRHLRVETSEDDLLINTLISAAREYAENYAGRSFIVRTLEYALSCLPRCGVELPRGPIVPGSLLIYYFNPADGGSESGDHMIAPSTYLIAQSSDGNPVIRFYTIPTAITGGNLYFVYESGYGLDPASVPAVAKVAMLMLIGSYYRYRSAVDQNNLGMVPLGVHALLDTIRTTSY